MHKDYTMSKVINLNKNQVSFDNLIKGMERHDFLGKEMKAYYNASSFNTFSVEDTASDPGLKAGVILHRKLEDGTEERERGLLFKGGFAIIVGENQKFDGGYEAFLSNMEAPVKDFKPGLEIKLSPAVAARLKSVTLALQAKSKGLAALIGKKKLFGSKDPKKKSAVLQHSNPNELEKQGLSIRIDEKFMLTIVDMFETTGTEMFRIAAGLVSLLDLSGFKAKMKVLEQEANKREEELNK